MKRLFSGLALMAPLLVNCSGPGAELGELETTENSSDSPATEADTDELVAEIFEVAEYIKKAFDFYRSARSVLATSSNDTAAVGRQLSQQLSSVRAELLDAIDQTQVDALQDEIDYLLGEFIAVAPKRTTDIDVVSRRSDLETDMKRLIHAYANRVERREPAEDTLLLAPAVNTIVANFIAVLKMKGELDPRNPTPWSSYNEILSEAMVANYRLVGAREVACSKGDYNPGHPHYCVGGDWCGLRDSVEAVGGIAGGLLFMQRADYRHRLDCRGSSLRNCSSVSCNAAQNRCWDGGTEHVCTPATAGMRQTFQECLWDARVTVQAGIDADPNVAVVREAMTAMRMVGGGESPRDDSNTTLPTRKPVYMGLSPAAMFDPKIPRGGNCPIPRGSNDPIFSRWYVVRP